LDWDDPLPTKLADNWLKWRADLDALQKFQLPRFVANDADNIELHGFSDASTKAYAAVVYSRVTNDDGSISVSLVAAKTRVVPLKQQSFHTYSPHNQVVYISNHIAGPSFRILGQF